jgi:hypothetical protein
MFSPPPQPSADTLRSLMRQFPFAGWTLLALSTAVTITAVACGSSNDAPAVCSTESDWTLGDEGSPLMHPGDACTACHTTKSEGPKFALAGTVMAASHDDTNCNGVQGATVEITGADGKVTTLNANAAGNFYIESMAALSTPYTAKVVQGSKVRAMAASQTVGDCNTCHTAAGANGAPGRILLPE